jgi:hypothetical protein
LRRLYARRPGPAARERTRARLAGRAAETLARRGLGGRTEVVPPNNARLLGTLVYLTDLDAFDRLAPRDGDLGPALARLTGAVRGGGAPFAALRALAPDSERR